MKLLIPFLLLALSPVMAVAVTVDVRDAGGMGDGQTVDTAVIQKAIDRCAATGGGTVHFPPGKWLSGTLVLKSHVTLHLAAGSTLLGSSNLEDYPKKTPQVPSYTDNYVNRSLIYAEDAKNVAIRGRGTIDGVSMPLFMRLGNRGRPYKEDVPKPPTGTFRNVVLSNIQATGASRIGVAIAGIPGHPIENVTLRDIRLEFAGGGTAEQAVGKIEERVDEYPEGDMFGILPAYGLYGRHVRNLRLENVQLVTTSPDARPATIFDDVVELRIDGQRIKE